MQNDELQRRFAALTAAHIADGCIRANVLVRCAPSGIHAVSPGDRIAGRVSPARHVGSVDVFLEVFESASPGDVLVVDNDGRLDESCVGDLATIEAQTAGLSAIVIWGLHRDTAEIRAIGLPVFSLGALPTGPQRLEPRHPDALISASVGEWTVGSNDVAFGDDDGVLFVPVARVEEVLAFAETIRNTERKQAEQIRNGVSLRSQVRFEDFLARRSTEPSLTLREHLRDVGGEIEV